MRYHHTPEDAGGNPLARFVYLANYAADLAGMGCGPGFNGDPMNPVTLKAVRFEEGDIQQLSVEIVEAVNEISTSLNI
jgi:hypothetical protein